MVGGGTLCGGEIARLSRLGADVAFDEDGLHRLIHRVAVDGDRLVDATDAVGIVLDTDFAFCPRCDGLAAPFGNCAAAATFGT